MSWNYDCSILLTYRREQKNYMHTSRKTIFIKVTIKLLEKVQEHIKNYQEYQLSNYFLVKADNLDKWLIG